MCFSFAARHPRRDPHPLCMLVCLGLAALFAAPLHAGNQVVRIRLSGPMLEAPLPDQAFAVLFGERMTTLYDCVTKIEKAADDDEVRGVALIIEDPQLSLAQLDELNRAFQDFRGKGKHVFAFLDYAGNLSYALAATCADHITLAEYSELSIYGLSAEVSFYKGLLDKIGVTAQMVHCGDYKAALEPFTRTEPSKPFAENINWLLDGIYARWIQIMADGRKLSADQMKEFVDQAPISAEDALQGKLVDAVGSLEDYRKLLRKEFGQDVEFVKKYPRKSGFGIEIDPANPFALFTQMNTIMEELFGGAKQSDKPGIALLYIDGGITTGESQPDFFSGSGTAGSTTIRAALDAIRNDDRVKAVVIRVNSPGGSALGSDIMWKAAMALKETRPLIVSMGGVAGSGGYYVSIPGDVIFAEEGTITASIGVVGGKMVLKGLFEDKLGITSTEFNRGAHSHMFSTNRMWTEAEQAEILDWMNDVYKQFKGRILTSRGDRIKGDLDSMAGGRVYTGRQALERGLIDRIGGLRDAIKLAAEKANLSDYEVYTFPEPKGFEAALAELMGQETEDSFELTTGTTTGTTAGAPGSTPRSALAARLAALLARTPTTPLAGALQPWLRELAPQRLRSVADDLRNLLILDREHVGCLMPCVPTMH